MGYRRQYYVLLAPSQDEITANKAGHAVNAMFESRAKLGAGHDLFAGKNPFGDFFRGARGSTG
jgi:hypothetical protein